MIRDRHDARPRIHVRQNRTGASFTYGPRGREHQAESIGAAVERAIASVDGREAVIFVERVG